MHATLLQSCPALYDAADCSPPGSSVRGILQAGVLEWAACPPPGYLPGPRIEPAPLLSPALADRFFTPSATCEAPGETWCGLHETTREPPGAQGEQEEGGIALPVRHSLLASTLFCRESRRTGDGWPRKQPQMWSGGGLPSLRSAATRVPRDPLVVFSIGAKHRDKE